ncbi:hypothetical protein Scep_017390 [Stephania cephalantha]|uniref:Uncharacterized protein n=1 Tax=Stephania cephalantha TaxID=152367 RepID=A0AAP0IRA8_9MAGN
MAPPIFHQLQYWKHVRSTGRHKHYVMHSNPYPFSLSSQSYVAPCLCYVNVVSFVSNRIVA